MQKGYGENTAYHLEQHNSLPTTLAVTSALTYGVSSFQLYMHQWRCDCQSSGAPTSKAQENIFQEQYKQVKQNKKVIS